FAERVETILIFEYSKISADFEFTNIKCLSLDESFCSIEYCFLKSVSRNYKYSSLKVNLHKVPIDKIKINFAIFKRLNGYKPFLYNITFDACKYLKNPQKYPVARFILSLFIPFSNMNHTCPYDHDLIVDKAPTSNMDHQLTNTLPFPRGDYGFFSIWYAFGIPRATVNVFGTLT
ncbi:hypothetical protein KR018_006562, partial [Drosophila ironensis]